MGSPVSPESPLRHCRPPEGFKCRGGGGLHAAETHWGLSTPHLPRPCTPVPPTPVICRITFPILVIYHTLIPSTPAVSPIPVFLLHLSLPYMCFLATPVIPHLLSFPYLSFCLTSAHLQSLNISTQPLLSTHLLSIFVHISPFTPVFSATPAPSVYLSPFHTCYSQQLSPHHTSSPAHTCSACQILLRCTPDILHSLTLHLPLPYPIHVSLSIGLQTCHWFSLVIPFFMPTSLLTLTVTILLLFPLFFSLFSSILLFSLQLCNWFSFSHYLFSLFLFFIFINFTAPPQLHPIFSMSLSPCLPHFNSVLYLHKFAVFIPLLSCFHH